MNMDWEGVRKSSIASVKTIVTLGFIARIFLKLKAILLEKDFSQLSQYINYNVVFVEVTLIANLIGNGLTYKLIPFYREVEELEGRQRVLDYINILFNTIGIILIIPSILVALGVYFFQVENFKLIGLSLPIIILSGLKSFYTSFLMMKHGFLAGSRGGVASGMIYVLYLVLIGQGLGVEGLMLVGVVATFAQLHIAYKVTEGNDYKYEFKLDFKDKNVWKIIRTTLFFILAIVIYDLSLSTKHTNTFVHYYVGLFLSAIITVSFPLLVETAEKYRLGKVEDYNNFNHIFKKIFLIILKFISPVLILLLVLSNLEKALFLNNNSEIPNLFIYLGFGFTAISLMPFILRSLIALGDHPKLLVLLITSFLLGRGLESINSKVLGDLGREIGLLMGVGVGLLIVNRKTNFIEEDLLVDLGGIFKSSTLMGLSILLGRQVYKGFLANIINNQFIEFSLLAGLGIWVYLFTGEKLNKGRGRNKVLES